MNKSIAVLMGGVVVGAFTLQALAQNKQPIQQTGGNAPASSAIPTPGVAPIRTAVLNINKVLKNFNKAQQLNATISAKVQYYGQQITSKRDQAVKLQQDLQKTVDPGGKDGIEMQLKQLEREMQDIDIAAKKDISARQGESAVAIYKDIEGVVQRVAAANGFDLVMSYPDATNAEDMYSQQNVVRKLASQAAIPLYYKQHIDISDAVVTTLNATFPVPPVPPSTSSSTPMPTNPAATPTPPATNALPKKQ